MNPYEALYRRQCHYPVGWYKLGEARLLGTDLVRDALEGVKLIRDRVRITQSRQKRYADRRARDEAFMVGERILLRVSPMKGVIRFRKKEMFRPRYIGTFEILDIVDFSSVQLDKDLTHVEESVAILDRQVRKLRSKSIALVKVQWRGQLVEEATWETDHDMHSRYPHLFGTSGMSLYSFQDERLFKRGRM
ncbi:uncharacterized protein [Nicotiana tomentosiformis]|uniref:uncharacterized protein n=1 Tax=Nicotiana tomentosiformis TaxID=4098 RepID=UPI00388CAC12